MTGPLQPAPRIAIACGGTGGHLFPGLAIAEELVRKGSAVQLIISPKEVDQRAVRQAGGLEILTVPAVGLVRGHAPAFARGLCQSYLATRKSFRNKVPDAALAMGGFTSAAPILAAKMCGAQTFLHESNTIPGRANRWLSWLVDQAFVGFAAATVRLHSRNTLVTGTPVRGRIQSRDPAGCRLALDLDPVRPVILVMGGSQGAKAINELVRQSLPLFARLQPQWQWIHLAGGEDCDPLRAAYASHNFTAMVRPFLGEMDLALGAASAAISRAGASSLAELAAMRLPSVLIPYPAATDNHQFYNARAFEQTGAASLLPQSAATPESLTGFLVKIMEDPAARQRMQQALGQWASPAAAERIASAILKALGIVTQAGSCGSPVETRKPTIPGDDSRCHAQGIKTGTAVAVNLA